VNLQFFFPIFSIELASNIRLSFLKLTVWRSFKHSLKYDNYGFCSHVYMCKTFCKWLRYLG